MDKEAQITDALQGAGSNIMESLKNAPDNISMFWDALSDTQKDTVINSLAGAAVGGLGSGLLGGDLSDSVVAALLGGAAGGGLTLGYNTLFGDAKLPSEAQGGPGLVERGVSSVANPILANPGASLGGTLGAWFAAQKGGIPFTDHMHIKRLDDWANAAKKTTLPTMANLGTSADVDARQLLSLIQDAKEQGLNAAEPALKPKTFSDVIDSLRTQGLGDTLKGLQEQGLGRRGVIERATAGTGAAPRLPRRLAWAALPAGLLAGNIADRYIQGEI
jgi:hypothetical protein